MGDARAIRHLGDGTNEAVDEPAHKGDGAAAAGQLLGGRDGPIRPALVVPGQEGDRSAVDVPQCVLLLDGERDALVNTGSLERQRTRRGVISPMTKGSAAIATEPFRIRRKRRMRAGALVLT